MYKVGKKLKEILEKNYNCKVYIADKSTTIQKNDRPMVAANLVADIYLAIHSNASTRYGTKAFYYERCNQRKSLASNLVNSLNEISPFSKNIP